VWFCSFSGVDTEIGNKVPVASACEQIVHVWNAADGALLHTFDVARTVPPPSISSVLFVPPGSSASSPSLLWTCCSFCPPEFGTTLLCVSSDRKAHFLNLEEKEEANKRRQKDEGGEEEQDRLLLPHLTIPLRAVAFAVAIDPYENHVYLGDDIGNIACITLT